jgi:serine O-acetyltransferase
MISSRIADWERERIKTFWSPARQLLKSIRCYQKCLGKKGLQANLNKKLAVVCYRYWTVITGADIPINVSIGGGLSIPHPNGIVIHPRAKIGVNCLIHQQVTIGVSRKSNKAPIIEGHVDIGAGAKIIGDITIGEHALIGANAVVVKDVPAYAIVAGIPAKIIGTTAEDVEIV